MCKKNRGNIIDDKKQKMKDYQKEYRKNITNEQKQKYKWINNFFPSYGKQSIVTLVLTCTNSKTRMESPQCSFKIQAKITPASCCSKILKYSLPDFKSTCFGTSKIEKVL